MLMLTAVCKMSEDQARRLLVTEAEEEMFKAEKLWRYSLLVPGGDTHGHFLCPESILKQRIPETPLTAEEAEEQSVRQEEEPLPLFTTASVKSETESDPETSAAPSENDRAITHECPFCNKTFTKKSNLKQHTRVHTGEKPFCCSFCKQLFGHKSALKVHLRIHTGEKPYCCSICKKAFVQRDHLQVHMRIHTGEKPFSCSVCEKTFTRNCFLVGHMRTHTGEKPFSCSSCDKTFTFKYKLEVHMRTHTGERPYGCSECDAAFTQKPHLAKHMNKHSAKRDSAEEQENGGEPPKGQYSPKKICCISQD